MVGGIADTITVKYGKIIFRSSFLRFFQFVFLHLFKYFCTSPNEVFFYDKKQYFVEEIKLRIVPRYRGQRIQLVEAVLVKRLTMTYFPIYSK